MKITLPLRLRSTMNLREHWAAKAKRMKHQRASASFYCGPLREFHGKHVDVTLTRIAPRPLDGDNLQAAFKAVRDGVADAMGYANDSDPRLMWHYAQARGEPRVYAVTVEVTPR